MRRPKIETIETHLAAGHGVEIEPTFLSDPKKPGEAILFCYAFWQRGKRRMSARFVHAYERETEEARDEELTRLCELPGARVVSETRADELLRAFRNGWQSAPLEAP